MKVICKFMSVKRIRLFDLEYSVKELKKIDPDLIKLFDSIKINTPNPGKNYFKALTRSIIYQQLSGSAAKTIFNRFKSIYSNNHFPTPKQVLETDIETFRASGLSYNKSYYIKNIAQAFFKEPDAYDNLSKMNDNEIIDILTNVKGIGLWTAQMFLIFTLNRADIFPATDLAIQKGYRLYFKLNGLPKPSDMIKHSEIWIPYRTTVSLYLWGVLEGPFEW